MKARQIYGLLSAMALTAVCASAIAQGGPPPQDDQNGPPPPMGMRRQGSGGPGMGGRMGAVHFEPLFMRPDVQKELKLSDEQIEKLQELLPHPPMMGGGPGGGGRPGDGPQTRRAPGGPGSEGRGVGHGDDFGGPPNDERGMRRHGGPEEMDKKLASILKESQMKRLKELRLQREGGIALTQKEIAEKVGLSDDDRYRIRGIIDEAMEQGQDGPMDPDQMREFHSQLSGKILKSLSSGQRSKWQSMTGKAFKFDENWHPQRAGRGPGAGFRRGGDQGNDGPPPPPSDEDDGGLEASLVKEALFAEANCF